MLSSRENPNTVSSKSQISRPEPPQFTDKTRERAYLKFRLAQAFRIFGQHGFDEGDAGHITVRDPIRPDCFWVNPFGLHFSLVQPSDLLLVSHSGEILDESGPVRILNTAAFAIHSAIHRARPDVNCAAHAHSIYGKAFSVLGCTLDMITQDACAFYRDHALYAQFRGVVLDEKEGGRIAEALGGKKALILQNHGLLTVGPNIEGTVRSFIALEKCCQAQLLVDAASSSTAKDGKKKRPILIDEAEAEYVYRAIGGSGGGYFGGSVHFAALETEEGVKFE